MPQTLSLLWHEHQIMENLLDILTVQLDETENAGNPNYELMSEIVDYFRGYPDLYHHPIEDIVYQQMLAIDPAQKERMVDLDVEHSDCEKLLNEFARSLVNVLLGVEVPRELFVLKGQKFIENERRHI